MILLNNKVLIELRVPDIDKVYNVFIPVNKKIGNIIILLSKAIQEETNNIFKVHNNLLLYNSIDGRRYRINDIVRKTDIRNGTKLVLM